MRLFSGFWLYSIAQSPYVDSRALLELFLFLDDYLTVGLCGSTESGVSDSALLLMSLFSQVTERIPC